ncbi:hypothetical protein HD597_004338 [Nonomuraea thailandensis]|uniref:DUF2092 domain-containing protein n=1 Tax=Nonomuraea thailandensis TaxID=1188745 RepID=A0A9X2GMG4_9ACTN|nr:hypothetical protein [Nonomuraea thailandensis]MCP2357318.1 hypothetical protein [Nonomuraea thailandensis]
MRSLRLLAPVAALLASTHLLAAPPAAAARPESLTPVIAAVKRQFASKSGVRFTAKSVERLVGIVTTSTSSGAYRLTASGVSASDVTEVDEEGRRFRLRTVGRASYTQDDRYDPLPKGKKWRARGYSPNYQWKDDLVDGINLGFLALAAAQDHSATDGGTVEGTPCTLLRGTVTVAGLGTTQPGVRFSTEEGGFTGGTISWRLWVGPDRLPRRFHAVITWDNAPEEKDDGFDYIKQNKIYRDWGAGFTITHPPGKSVAPDNW